MNVLGNWTNNMVYLASSPWLLPFASLISQSVGAYCPFPLLSQMCSLAKSQIRVLISSHTEKRGLLFAMQYKSTEWA